MPICGICVGSITGNSEPAQSSRRLFAARTKQLEPKHDNAFVSQATCRFKQTCSNVFEKLFILWHDKWPDHVTVHQLPRNPPAVPACLVKGRLAMVALCLVCLLASSVLKLRLVSLTDVFSTKKPPFPPTHMIKRDTISSTSTCCVNYLAKNEQHFYLRHCRVFVVIVWEIQQAQAITDPF